MSQLDIKIESYPPFFRQSCPNHGVDSGDDHDHDAKSKGFFLDSDPIPVIDFQCVEHGKLSKACRDWGVFRLVNHGISVDLLDRLHNQTRDLFSLDFESKQGLFFNTPISYFWGTPALTPSGIAINTGDALQQNFNWVEGLNVPFDRTSLVEDHHHHHVAASFRVLLEEYGRQLSRLAATLFEAMAKNLQLDTELCRSYLSPTTGLLRVYRYPRCLELEVDRPWGMGVHTDSSVLTILNQDEVGGLQVSKDDVWFDVKPIPTTLLINLGDMMQAISDDKYTSVKHRVKVNRQNERISVGYFVFPAEDAVIESSTYKPFTYGDFRAQVQQDLKTIGSKVGLSRFKKNGMEHYNSHGLDV